jgi:hypothetical protein
MGKWKPLSDRLPQPMKCNSIQINEDTIRKYTQAVEKVVMKY